MHRNNNSGGGGHDETRGPWHERLGMGRGRGAWHGDVRMRWRGRPGDGEGPMRGRGRGGGRGERPEAPERPGEGRGGPGGFEGRMHGLHGRHGEFGGRFGDFGGRGGWGRRGGQRAARGDVRAVVLALLAEQPLHGYEIIQQITARSGGAWRPSPGSVYPALQLLEDEGLIVGEQTEGKRVFHLTDAGRAHVEQHRQAVTAAWSAVASNVDDPARELHGLLGQVGVAMRQVVEAGTDAQLSEARNLLINTRRQLYRILAEDDADSEQGSTPQGNA